jgi:small subunit ribosomal protein S6
MHKAHYVLMNIECDGETLTELEHAFKFNDAVLRHLVVKMDKAHTTPSPMMKEEKSRSLMGEQRGEQRGETRGDRPAGDAPAPAAEAEAPRAEA